MEMRCEIVFLVGTTMTPHLSTKVIDTLGLAYVPHEALYHGGLHFFLSLVGFQWLCRQVR